MKLLILHFALCFFGFSCLYGQEDNNMDFKLKYHFDDQCNLVKFVPIVQEKDISDSVHYSIILAISKPRNEREENAIFISNGFINEYDRDFILNRGYNLFNAEVKLRFLSSEETYTIKDILISIEELKCK